MQHVCNLPVKDTSGLHKLPPNASWIRKFLRNLRKCCLLNPDNHRGKKLYRNKSSLLAERKRHACGPNSFVIHPLSLCSTLIETLFCITWLYCLICDPFMIYADEFSEAFRTMQTKVVFTLRLIVIVLFFNVGYIDHKTKKCVVERKKIIFKYLTTYFIFDIFSTTCLIVAKTLTSLGLAKCALEDSVSNCYGYLYFIRLVCCGVRINNLFKSVDDVCANMRIHKQARIVIMYLLKTFMYLHLFAFLVYFMPYTEFKGKWPAESWLAQAEVSHEEDFRMQYAQCMILSISFFFGISYRFNIEVFREQVCLTAVAFCGRLYTLYLLADILNVFGIVGISESMYERQLISLEEYMAEKDLPVNLRQRMVRYYEYKFQKQYFREHDILSTISEHLRTELFLYTARKLVQKVEFFKRLPNTTLGAIIGAMRSETFSSKDVIVRVGSEIEDIYFISTGTVAVLNRFGVELCHLDDGEEFGASCIVLKEQLFSVVAVETTEVFSINKDMFLEFLSPHAEVMATFQRSVKQKFLKYRAMEDSSTQGTVNLFSELKKGNILERRSKKLVAH